MDESQGRGDSWIKGDANTFDAIPDITLIVNACYSGAFCLYLKEQLDLKNLGDSEETKMIGQKLATVPFRLVAHSAASESVPAT